MLDSPSLVAGLAAVTTILAHQLYQYQFRLKPRLPPGPKSYPLIGHLLSLPTEAEYLEFQKISEQIGSKIICLSAFGTNVIVLSDRNDAVNLFEKRSAIYSDRPRFPMVSEPSLFYWENFGSAVPYGDRWRAYRRMLNPWLNKQAATAFHGSQEHETRSLLRRLLKRHKEIESSEDLESEFYLTAASTLLRSIYGHRVESPSDPVLVGAQQMIARLGVAGLSSNFLVNTIPALMYVPSWLPGAAWKRTARIWRKEKDVFVNDTYRLATNHIKEGNNGHIIVASFREQALRLGLTEEETDDYVRELAITLFGAGADTTSGSLAVFAMAMILFPHVQRLAQKELDERIESGRLPTLEDQSRLEYIGRVIQEVLRWAPVTPLGVPHSCFEDDNYKGYDIPKGTVILGNVWAMSRDAEVYNNPDTFDPDRFLDPAVPPVPGFGWGRRRCPGMHFAEASLFIAVASILSTFNIMAAKDKNGDDILPQLRMVNAIVLHPEPFKFKLAPRSTMHESLILSEVEDVGAT